jgi:hypothetical protein
MARYWVEWHRAYQEPDSNLSRRLVAVRAEIGRALDATAGPVRVISMCAGLGLDLIGTLADRTDAARVSGRLVEWDPDLSAGAADGVTAAGLAAAPGKPGLEVVRADAGSTAAYAGAVPADLVLVCGVFGNLSDADVRGTIGALPGLCAPGATVVWTRGQSEPDRWPVIRRWFAEAGFAEVAFTATPGDYRFAVGSQRLVVAPAPFEPDRRLFRFQRGTADGIDVSGRQQ